MGFHFICARRKIVNTSYNNNSRSGLRWPMDVGQKNLANYHGDVFIGQGSAYVRGCSGLGDMCL